MNPINFFTYNIISLLDKHLHQRKIKFYLSKVLKNPNYILDIGAHKGFYSDLFLKLYSSVKIILFEPNLILYKNRILLKKMKYNAYTKAQNFFSWDIYGKNIK